MGRLGGRVSQHVPFSASLGAGKHRPQAGLERKHVHHHYAVMPGLVLFLAAVITTFAVLVFAVCLAAEAVIFAPKLLETPLYYPTAMRHRFAAGHPRFLVVVLGVLVVARSNERRLCLFHHMQTFARHVPGLAFKSLIHSTGNAVMDIVGGRPMKIGKPFLALVLLAG